MKKRVFLAVAAVLLVVPAVASAQALEGSFSGRANHNGSPGVYNVGSAYDVYETLNTTQQFPWYPWNAANEYTLVISTTVSSYSGASNPQTVTFADASFSIYEDAANNANFANTATFTDGVLILTGSITNWAGSRINCCNLPWGVTGDAAFTGGAGLGNLDVLCDGGNVRLNDFINFAFGYPDAQGYEEGYDSKLDCPGAVSTEESTWGTVKALYR